MEFHLDEFKKAGAKIRAIVNPTPLQKPRTFGEMAG